MRFLNVILAVILCAAATPARAGLFNAESFTLSNGLKVVVIPNRRTPVVTHMIWYKFGGSDEMRGKSGIAHFLEHLMFKGTARVPDGIFSQTVKKMGGNDNAFTTRDYTAYYQNVPRARLAEVMEMEADRMRNLALKDDEVASERQVIIEERKQRIDNSPQARFQEQMQAALFVNHPYGTPVIGWLHEMQELTKTDALESYRKWYAPNNAILVVAGDISAEELKPMAQKYYGLAPSQKVPARARPRAAPLVAEQRLTLSDPRIGQPVVMKFYRAPRGSEALELLADILGGSSTARLYKTLVVDKKLAVSAGAGYDAISLDDTSFSLSASPAPGIAPEKLETALNEEIKKLLEKGITEEELQAAKNRAIASFTYYRDSLQGPAMLFGRALASGFDIDDIEDRETRINAVSSEDIHGAARQVLGALPVTGILLPGEKK